MHVNGEDVEVVAGENKITVEGFVDQGLYVQFGSKADETMIIEWPAFNRIVVKLYFCSFQHLNLDGGFYAVAYLCGDGCVSTTENIEWTIDKTSVATVKGSGAGNKLCTVYESTLSSNHLE